MSNAAPIIYTIGHSNHGFETFLSLLRACRISELVDVRSQPYSKRMPHFCKAALESALSKAGPRYHFFGEALGGRPVGAGYYLESGELDCAARAEAPDFLAAIDRLLLLAQRAPTAIMCAEEDPGGCHRTRLIAPVLRERGVCLLHIRRDGRIEPDTARRAAPRQLKLF